MMVSTQSAANKIGTPKNMMSSAVSNSVFIVAFGFLIVDIKLPRKKRKSMAEINRIIFWWFSLDVFQQYRNIS